MMNPRLLRQCSLFAGLGEEDLAQIASVSSVLRLSAGERVLTEGDVADAFFIVISGAVRVVKSAPSGREQVLRFAGPNEVFGEAAAFALGAYPASAEAIERTTLVRVEAQGFLDLLAGNPRLSANVIMTLFHRLQELVAIVEDLSLKDVASRLSRYLLELVDRSGRPSATALTVQLDVKKGELAARLGTVSETLSRTFARLREQGVLEVEGRRVRVLNPVALRAIAEGKASQTAAPSNASKAQSFAPG